jgi:hypothetical protein
MSKKKKPTTKKNTKTPVTKKVTKRSKPKSKNVVVENNYVNDSTKFWQDFEKDLLYSKNPKEIFVTPIDHSNKIYSTNKLIADLPKSSKSWSKKYAENLDEAWSEVVTYLFEHPLITSIAATTIVFTIVMAVMILMGHK